MRGCCRRRLPDAVLDLCCGCGAIGLALAREIGAARCTVSSSTRPRPAARPQPGAVRPDAGGPGTVGDLYAPLPGRSAGNGSTSCVANAPYVPTDALAFMPAESRLYEPAVALDGGVDGLAVLRRVIAEAPQWLRPGAAGCSSRRAGAGGTDARGRMRAAGLRPSLVRDEELEATAVVGTAPVEPLDRVARAQTFARYNHCIGNRCIRSSGGAMDSTLGILTITAAALLLLVTAYFAWIGAIAVFTHAGGFAAPAATTTR